MEILIHILIILACLSTLTEERGKGKRFGPKKLFKKGRGRQIPIGSISGSIGDGEGEAVSLVFTSVIREEANPLLKPRRLLVRSKQLWNGLEIWGHGATFIQGKEASAGDAITKTVVQDISTHIGSVVPNISKPDAYRIAIQHTTGSTTNTSRFEVYPENGNHTGFKLLVFVDKKQNVSKLVYRFNFMISRTGTDGQAELNNAFVTVNANDGSIVESYEGLVSSFLDGGDGGNINVGRYTYGEGLWAGRRLEVTKKDKKCKPVNPLAIVSSANGLFMFPPNLCFTEEVIPSYSEPCSPVTPNQDATGSSYSQVHDALYFATDFQRMLQNKFGDNTLQECCGQMRLCVHFNMSQVAFFYRDVDDGHCDTFYQFTDTRFLASASPSLVAHELTHGLVGCTSELESTGQAGAISESFCDLAGVLYKASLNRFKPDWKFGSEILYPFSRKLAIRYLDYPPQDGVSIQHTDDYSNKLDIHFSSGIYNKAIYNLATNDHWNINKVFQVFLRANKFYWKATTTFDDGLCDLIEAARDYDFNIDDVKDAFAKVGVFCGCPEGWVKYNVNDITSCIKILPEKATWATASIYCKSLKGQLLRLVDQARSDLVKSLLNPKKSYWLGATDMTTEGSWEWMGRRSGNKNFTDWLPNTPTTDVLMNCMAMVYDPYDQAWGWTDEVCSKEIGYICELT